MGPICFNSAEIKRSLPCVRLLLSCALGVIKSSKYTSVRCGIKYLKPLFSFLKFIYFPCFLGCVGSYLRYTGSSLRCAGSFVAALGLFSSCGGRIYLSACGARAPGRMGSFAEECELSSCGAGASLPRVMRDLSSPLSSPGPGIVPCIGRRIL